MYFRTLFRACAVLTAALLLASAAAAQTGTSLTGRLANSLSGDPVGDLTVTIDELRRETQAGADGTFRFDNVPPGEYHLSIRGDGFTARRTEVRVASTTMAVDIQVDPVIHYDEVRVGQPRAAQSGRVLSADHRAGRPGTDQAARQLPRLDAREPAGPRVAQLRPHAGASSDSRDSTAIAC